MGYEPELAGCEQSVKKSKRFKNLVQVLFHFQESEEQFGICFNFEIVSVQKEESCSILKESH